MIVDMHCHLDLYSDPWEVARKCKNIDAYILSVTTTPQAWLGTLKLGEGNPRIRTALGFHPQLAHKRVHELELFDTILPTARYVGEIGLDGGKEYKEYSKVQLDVFRHILKTVKHAGGRIMSIHSRSNASGVLDELERDSDLGIPILHWFTGNEIELKRAIGLGCWFSIGPAMIQTRRGQVLISRIPRNRILTETDGPFAKIKNQILMPWDSVLVAPQLARLWGAVVADVENILQENFKNLISHSHTAE